MCASVQLIGIVKNLALLYHFSAITEAVLYEVSSHSVC